MITGQGVRVLDHGRQGRCPRDRPSQRGRRPRLRLREGPALAIIISFNDSDPLIRIAGAGVAGVAGGAAVRP